MTRITLASRSAPGARPYNEDDLEYGTLGGGWFAVLADGAGGHTDGAIASDLVVCSAVQALAQRAGAGSLAPADLGEVLLLAHDALCQRQIGLQGQQRMLSTLVLLWIDTQPLHAFWAHVGDSRLYLLRQGRVEAVTCDDSVVQRLVEAGLLDAEQAREHPQRHQLIAALGDDEPVEPHICPAAVALREGDAFLLCSDGWYDAMAPGDIEATLARAHSAEAWLVAMDARVRERQVPNQDNFSAIAVWVGSPAEVTRIGAA